MKSHPRDFVTVDMRGLKAALEARAIESGRSVSDLVRTAVGIWLGEAPCTPSHRLDQVASSVPSTVKLTIRFSGAAAAMLDARAQEAGVSRGALIGGLLSEVPVMVQASVRPADVVSALIASNAQVSTLARQVAQLCIVLERGDGQAARAYRMKLAGMVEEVRAHLRLTAQALDVLRPRRGNALERIGPI
jgi:hypothetical protein